MSGIQLNYHQPTFDLIQKDPRFSQRSATMLRLLERVYGYSWPQSVREWFSLENATDIIKYYSNEDVPLTLEDLEHAAQEQYTYRYWDFAGQEMLPFIVENQGSYLWAIHLNDSDDPPVGMWDEHNEWHLCAPRFSEFVCLWVWKHLYWTDRCVLHAKDIAISESTLQSLRQHFTITSPAQITNSSTIFHFYRDSQKIHLWRRNRQETYWWLHAASEESLFHLAHSVWFYGTLKQTLQDIQGDRCASDVLQRLRSSHS
jgi:hypothetical protein